MQKNDRSPDVMQLLEYEMKGLEWNGAPAPIAPPADGDCRKLRILLVDDNELIVKLLAIGLERNGHVVSCAADGDAAWRLLEGGIGRYDLIISDVQMPGMDGWELARRARHARFKGPILIMSANADMVVNDTDGTPLADGILAKPFTIEVLQAQIRRLLFFKKSVRRPARRAAFQVNAA